MNTQTTTISKTTRKYLDIIASGVIEESQIISMKSLMGKDKEAAKAIFNALDGIELELTSGQQPKGFDFLKDAWKTPRGTERKNNPFGYREQAILENGTDIALKGFYDASTYGQNAYYLPIYSVNSANGSFEYYYNGEINIIG